MHVPTSDDEEAWGWYSGDETRSRSPQTWAARRIAQSSDVRPRHNLRRRKPAQLRPYTLEAISYRQELVRNDWEDAVVYQRGIDAARRRTRSPSLTASPQHDEQQHTAAESHSDASPAASSDSTDYERRFRVLKRMMPARAARRCIEDLPTKTLAITTGIVEAWRDKEAAQTSDSEPPSLPPEVQPSPPQEMPLLPETISESSDEREEQVGTVVPRATVASRQSRFGRRRRTQKERDAVDKMLSRAKTLRAVFSEEASEPSESRRAIRRTAAPRESYKATSTRIDAGSHQVLFEEPKSHARRVPKKVVRNAVWVAPPEAPPPQPKVTQQTLPSLTRRQAVPPELHDQLAEACTWETLENVRLDFGIVPPAVGTRLDPHSFVGRGRLHVLLHDTISQKPSSVVMEKQLDGDMSIDDAGDALALVFDHIVDGHVERGIDGLYFFGQWFTWKLRDAHFETSRARSMLLEMTQGTLDQLTGSGDAVIALLWFRVDIVWRLHKSGSSCTDDVLANAQPLVHALLGRAHHVISDVNGVAAQAWICTIHILIALDGPGAFWDVLDGALEDWHATRIPQPIIWCEAVWHILGTVCALSCYGAAAGMASSAPRLDAHWSTIQRILTILPLRFDERVERAAPRAAMRRRDAYIRIVLHRILLFADRWNWSLAAADGVVARMFDVFDSHRLGDLPTETDHDFAPFLRKFDQNALSGAHTAFHMYLELLGKTAACGGHAARLFSRVTPVRVMPFTRHAVPTMAERSMLFNHYSAVMLFLYYVPSLALQRLRQIKSFLVFSSADASSRIACVRAMMYAGVVLRHHKLDIAPVSQWFKEVIYVLLDEHASAGSDELCQREALRTLVVVLRSISHVIAHAALTPDAKGYPPLGLLLVACDRRVLGVANDKQVCTEVLGCINQYLRARKQTQQKKQILPASQSSDMDLDDTLLYDEALGQMLGEDPARSDDAAFAQYAHDTLSPALFRLLTDSQHPDVVRKDEARVETIVRQAEEESFKALLVDCWAGCAAVIVAHELRDWRSYFTLGKESWKRLGDPVEKRNVALRLAVNVALIDQSAYTGLRAEFFGIMLQSLAADAHTLQSALLGLLVYSLDPPSPLLHGVLSMFKAPELRLDPFEAAQRIEGDMLMPLRGELVALLLANLAALVTTVRGIGTGTSAGAGASASVPWTGTRKAAEDMPLVVSCVSALLSSIRAYASVERDGRSQKEFVAFSRHVLHCVQSMGDLVERAVRTELSSTAAAINSIA
ncbi:hypothetical protein MCUN1_003106 [Malassezia cuniculi]|uniref:Uncharacterized protein n=1 Tax=Malassezia cuniculi TaxID=948313 RepID=A0AAF0ESJ4_9BASI|nr:hypothetical protein MCUN1_003106 [Malassezia cuniculi]